MDDELLDGLKAEMDRIRSQHPGWEPAFSDVLRATLRKGLGLK